MVIIVEDERKGGMRERLLAALAEHSSVPDAARIAGCSDRNARYWLSDPGFILALFKSRQRRLQSEGGTLGLSVLIKLAEDEKTPHATRYQAAKTLLNLAGHIEATAVQALSDNAPAALLELSEDQLRQHIAAAEAVLTVARRVVIDHDPGVTPDATPSAGDPDTLL